MKINMLSDQQIKLFRDAVLLHDRPHLAPLVDAIPRGADLALVLPGQSFPAKRRKPGQGMVVVIGDDRDAGTSTGPAGFIRGRLRKLIGNASAWAVMSGAAIAAVYEGAAIMAMTGAIVVLIESQEQTENAWLEFCLKHGRRDAGKLLASPSGGSPGGDGPTLH